MKQCNECNTRKNISEFYGRPNYHETKAILYQSMCKECAVQRTKTWRLANRNRHNEYQRKYQREHRKKHESKSLRSPGKQ